MRETEGRAESQNTALLQARRQVSPEILPSELELFFLPFGRSALIASELLSFVYRSVGALRGFSPSPPATRGFKAATETLEVSLITCSRIGATRRNSPRLTSLRSGPGGARMLSTKR